MPRAAWAWLRTAPGGATAAAFAFVAISVWWLLVDTAPPDNDATKHLNYAIDYFHGMEDGDFFAAFTGFDPAYAYPPLIHFIAATAMWVGGEIDVASTMIVVNALFVPLLAGGCYLAGRVAYGPIVGLASVLFALGAPMMISQFHSFMLDAPLAALTAASVGAMVMSNRFASWRWSAAAGLLMGLGMLVKSSFVVFVIGFAAIAIVRGGWRNWKNVLVCGALVAAVSVPWHLAHYDELHSHTAGITSGGGSPPIWYGTTPYPERWSFENFTWYGWSALNNQLYLPLLLLAIAGLVYAAVRIVRHLRARSLGPADYTPELLAGAVVSYVSISWLPLDDPRYTLPMIVYLGVLGTAWLAAVRGRVRSGGLALVAAIFALNTATVDFGFLQQEWIVLPGASDSPIAERKITLIGPGYAETSPDRGARLQEIFEAARRDGVKYVGVGGQVWATNFFGPENLHIVVRMAGLEYGTDGNKLGPDDIFMYPEYGPPAPNACSYADREPFSFHFRRGDGARRPYTDYPPYCPVEARE